MGTYAHGVREGDFNRFCGWAATFALLTAGVPMLVIGFPLVICGGVGVVYLARRPPRWPALLGIPAGIGVTMMLDGLAIALLSASYEVAGTALIAGGAVLIVASFLFFRRRSVALAGVTRSGASPSVPRGAAPKTLRLFPLILAVPLFLIPSGYLWVNGNNSDLGSKNLACFEAFRYADETAEITDEPSLWPPGGKCALHAPDGSVTLRSREVPWLEWIALGALLRSAQPT